MSDQEMRKVVITHNGNDHFQDKRRLKEGNVYRTKEEAETVVDQLLKKTEWRKK